MKPKMPEDKDQKMINHDLLLGIKGEEKPTGRVELVMEIVYLFEEIENIKDKEIKEKVKDKLAKVITGLKLTNTETNLLNFEKSNLGV